MGRVTVKFHGVIAEIAGITETCSVEVEKDSTFEEVITRLENTYGRRARNALLEPKKDRFPGHVAVLINGYRIDNVKTKITDGSIIDVFAIVFGG